MKEVSTICRVAVVYELATPFCNRCQYQIRTNVASCIVLSKSAFSFLRRLITWHCPHLLLCDAAGCGAAAADRRPCSNRSISPARRAHSNKPAAAECGGRMGQTDGRTDTVPLLYPALHTGRSVIGANKLIKCIPCKIWAVLR